MIKNHKLARSLSDAAFGEFRRQLEYKAKWYGSEIFVVDRFYPSSKTCSKCGYVNKCLVLGDRQWLCPDCATAHDRDINAAVNIKQEGCREFLGLSTWRECKTFIKEVV